MIKISPLGDNNDNRNDDHDNRNDDHDNDDNSNCKNSAY